MKNKINLIVRIFAISFSVLLIVSCGGKTKDAVVRDFPEIKESGNLIVVMEYSSISYQRKDSIISGRQYELVKDLASSLGLTPVIKLENSFSKSLEGLNKGEYDLMARLTPITSELKGKVAFTYPISKDRQVLVQRVKSDTTSEYVSNVLQLKNKTIHIAEDSPFMSRIENLEEEVGFMLDIQNVEDYNNEQIATLVSTGDIDYSICDFATAIILKEKYKNLDVSVNISFTQLQAWAVRPSAAALLDSVNSWISTLPKNKRR